MLAQTMIERAKAIQDWMVKIRRDFHKYPELSSQEKRTRDMITSYLKSLEIPYKTFNHHYGVIGLIRGKGGSTVALRADMDALPIEDRKHVEYASQNRGVMHACGHDAHMTILLGAARLLAEDKNLLQGNVLLVFQPAEETTGGAKQMIEDGIFDDSVKAIFGLHVSNEIPTGKIGIRYGQMNAASDMLTLKILGKSTHGAYPHEGVDAIVIAGQMICALQTIISRATDPRDSAALTFGTIRGGSQNNIVADEVTLTGTLRTLSPSTREALNDKIRQYVEYIPKGMGGRGILERIKGYPALTNHPQWVKLIIKTATSLLGKDAILQLEKPSLGVEDFAYFLEKIPGAFYQLGCRNEAKGTIHPGHNDLFDIDEDCLPIGASLQAACALEALSSF